jgi:homoserine O-succinyltransferase
MPIALPAGLPARQSLLAEGIEVLTAAELRRRSGRPLRLCLVNLMPNKAATEKQIARLVGATPIAVELTLCLPDGYRSRSTPSDHLTLYRPWTSLRDEAFDALIVTGAPIETLPFEEVTYWSDLCAIFEWAKSRAINSLYLCWAAQAALYHSHGVPKHRLREKRFGVFRQRVVGQDRRLLRGFGEEFPVPVSRHTEVRVADLPLGAGLRLLAASQESGACLIAERDRPTLYMFNHLEYDGGTLRDEYLRDRLVGKETALPSGYFPEDDARREPVNVWQPYAHLLFANWLGEIHRALPPKTEDEPLVQWTLAGSLIAPAEGAHHSYLLISAATGDDILPAVLRALAEIGHTPQALKVHWRSAPGQSGTGQFIELRMGRLHEPALERIARRLSGLTCVSKVAFRSNGVVGGWLVGHRSGAAPRSRAPEAA